MRPLRSGHEERALHEPPLERLEELIATVEEAFRGRHRPVRLAVTTLLAGGHLLLEDVPGVGKTTLARALATAFGLDFRRIQFTSDLLPSDVLGVSLYNPRTRSFETRPGPIFTNVVLADEINRAPPRTQSGLLEAMQEAQVTIDDRSLPLPSPFLVMATQNPLEQHGTYPLPESQLDRFLVRLSIGWADPDEERRLVVRSATHPDPVHGMRRVLGPDEVLALQRRVESVHADPSLVEYIMAVVHATRAEHRFRSGVSTRGAIGLFRAARAHALVCGRSFLIPDDVHDLAGPCFAHRLSLRDPGADDDVAEVLAETMDSVPLPA